MRALLKAPIENDKGFRTKESSPLADFADSRNVDVIHPSDLL